MRRALACCLLTAVSACAAILGTKQKDFTLQSSPTGAEVYLDGNRVGTTPARVELSNMKEHTFVFKKAGYKDVSCTLTKGTDGGWVVADILFAGLIGVIVDGTTGSWSQTRGKSCTAAFEPLPEPMIAAAAPKAQPIDAARTPVARIEPAMGYQPATGAETPADPAPVVEAVPVRPVAGVTKLPTGTNWVGDARIRVYYPLGCAAQHAIPPEQQVFFQTAAGAESDGFKRSGDC